jgi:hypothetical protein
MSDPQDSITVHEGQPPGDEWATPGTLRRTRPILDVEAELERLRYEAAAVADALERGDLTIESAVDALRRVVAGPGNRDRLSRRAEPPRLPSPFSYVAATRYAIRRWLTSASEIVAADVLQHADHIRTEPGAAAAILREIEDLVDRPGEPTFGTERELAEHVERWQRVAQRLGGHGEERRDG